MDEARRHRRLHAGRRERRRRARPSSRRSTSARPSGSTPSATPRPRPTGSGLEMAIFSSPGWSETGGPWVKPEQAMKKLVWSETDGRRPAEVLRQARPSRRRNNGQIRNTGAQRTTRRAPRDPTVLRRQRRRRVSHARRRDAMPPPRVRSSRPATAPSTARRCSTINLNTLLTIPAPKDGGPAWVQFEFPQPFTARAITLGGRGGSANGIPVGRVLAERRRQRRSARSSRCPARSSTARARCGRSPSRRPRRRFYRIELTGAPLGPAPTMSQAPPQPAAEYVLSEAILHGGARVHRWEEKAGFSFLFEYEHRADARRAGRRGHRRARRDRPDRRR